MIDLNKLKTLAEAATHGPWMAWGEVGNEVFQSPSGSKIAQALEDRDMDFIAAANPSAVLDLIAIASVAAPQVVADELTYVRNLELVINRLETISQNNTDIPRTLADEALICARAALAAAPVQAQEPVAEVSAMPGTSGFTMAAFKADDMPIGSKIYRAPVQPVAVPDGWRIVEKSNCYLLCEGNMVIASLTGPEAKDNAAIIARLLAAPAAQGDAKEPTDKQLIAAFSNIFYSDYQGNPDGYELAIGRAAIAAKAAS